MATGLTNDWAKLQTVVAASKTLRYNAKEPKRKVVEDMSVKILLLLCKSVMLEKNNHESIAQDGLSISSIGIGSTETWHGSPDIRMLPDKLNVVLLREEEMEEINEYKRVRSEDVRSRVIATTVVTSFTQKKMAPILLMCKRRVRVCVYDCESDILGYSEKVVFPMGVYLIWAMVHNR